MADEPVGGVAELAARGGAVAAAHGASRAVPGGGESAPRPAPQVVEVVGEGDGEAGAGGARLVPPAPHIQPAGGSGSRPSPASRGAQHGAQKLDVAVDGGLVDAQGGVGGEHAGRVRQAAVLVARGGRALVPAGEQDESGGDEVEGDGEAGAGLGGEGGDGGAVAARPCREGAGRQRPPCGEELEGRGAARDGRYARRRAPRRRRGRRRRTAPGRASARTRRPSGASIVSRAHWRARQKAVGRVDGDGKLGQGHTSALARGARVTTCFVTVSAFSRPGSGSRSE